MNNSVSQFDGSIIVLLLAEDCCHCVDSVEVERIKFHRSLQVAFCLHTHTQST